MIKLKQVEQKNGFFYNQLKRNEKAAVYEQRDKHCTLHGHEVFRITSVKEKEVFGKIIPEHEKFPANADFGITAWSTGIDPNKAFAKFNSIT